MEPESILSSNTITFSAKSNCELCPTSPRATVYMPAISISTAEHSKLQQVSEKVASSYYVYSEVLLSTALVLVENHDGEFIPCRAMLDSGSQLSLVAQNCAKRLRLLTRQTHVHASGVTGAKMHTIHQVSSITLKSSLEPSFRCTLDAFIVPQVVGPMPARSFERGNWPHVAILRMADPDYNLSREVDVLLGADCLSVIIRSGLKVGAVGQPLAQLTAFGWVLLGPIALKVEPIHLMPKEKKNLTDVSESSGEKEAAKLQGSFSAESSTPKMTCVVGGVSKGILNPPYTTGY